MDERSGETVRQQVPTSAAPGEGSNRPATTSLVLGIVAFWIPLLVLGLLALEEIDNQAAWDRFVRRGGEPPEYSIGIPELTVACLVSLPLAISAIVFGLRGRRRAKAGAPGRSSATTGLVLGIVVVAAPITALLAFIFWISCCDRPSF